MIDLPKKDKDGVNLLSYSQISAFRRNKRDYIRRYFLNEPFIDNDYTSFGSKVGKALELGDFSAFTAEEKKLLETVPRLDEFEKEISLEYKDLNLRVIGYIDTNDNGMTIIYDYKTGSEGKESEYLKDDYVQPIIYAMATKNITGELPKDVAVIFIERLGNPFKGDELKVGEYMKKINIPINDARIAYTNKLILDTATEITRYYNVFRTLNK